MVTDIFFFRKVTTFLGGKNAIINVRPVEEKWGKDDKKKVRKISKQRRKRKSKKKKGEEKKQTTEIKRMG